MHMYTVHTCTVFIYTHLGVLEGRGQAEPSREPGRTAAGVFAPDTPPPTNRPAPAAPLKSAPCCAPTKGAAVGADGPAAAPGATPAIPELLLPWMEPRCGDRGSCSAANSCCCCWVATITAPVTALGGGAWELTDREFVCCSRAAAVACAAAMSCCMPSLRCSCGAC